MKTIKDQTHHQPKQKKSRLPRKDKKVIKTWIRKSRDRWADKRISVVDKLSAELCCNPIIPSEVFLEPGNLNATFPIRELKDDLDGVTKEMFDAATPKLPPNTKIIGEITLTGTGGESKVSEEELKDIFYDKQNRD